MQVTRWSEWSKIGRDLPAVKITGRGDTHQHLGLLVSASKSAATVSPGLTSKSASVTDDACGTLAEFAPQLSKVINGQMDFRPA